MLPFDIAMAFNVKFGNVRVRKMNVVLNVHLCNILSRCPQILDRIVFEVFKIQFF